MHSQTIMQILVSLFLITTRNGHPKKIGSILYIYVYLNNLSLCIGGIHRRGTFSPFTI